MREITAFKESTVAELMQKTKEIDALKAEIRITSELAIGQVKQKYVEEENSDPEMSQYSETSFGDFEYRNSLGKALKDENGSHLNTESSTSGLCDMCKAKHRSRRMLNPASAAHVAFFARLSKNTPYLNPNQDIVFDHVVTNIGNGYHGNHGLFVAPVSGLYVFSVTLMALLPGPGIHSNHAKLVKNGQMLARLTQQGVSLWDTSTITIAVELQKNDDIAVQNSDCCNMTFWGDDYCTFSGFLLYETANSPNVIGK